MVRMHPVESSSIRAIGYDAAAEELWIEFRSSPDPYVYFAVPPEVYAELEEAEPKGEYVNLMIKPHYRSEHRRRPRAVTGQAQRRPGKGSNSAIRRAGWSAMRARTSGAARHRKRGRG